VAKKTNYQLLEEVARIERIPADREATTEEIRLVDDLAARLRVSAPRGKRYRNLYEPVKGVQARMGAQRGVEQAENKTDSDCPPEPPAPKKKGRGSGGSTTNSTG
jgi:hypothetical protein